jgi:hypothetical protein
MRFSMLLGTALLVATGASAAEPQPAPLDRAKANYEAILRGEKRLFDLTPTEQDQVRALDHRIRATEPPDTRNPYERCYDAEVDKLGREPSDLDKRTIDTRCR